jgi:hypothetical protein
MEQEELVRGLSALGSAEHLCGACQRGKQRRNPFPAQAQERAERVLVLVHGDLCGKISLPTPASNNYFLLMVDDKSQSMSIVLLSSRNQAAEAIRKFQWKAEVENRPGR